MIKFRKFILNFILFSIFQFLKRYLPFYLFLYYLYWDGWINFPDKHIEKGKCLCCFNFAEMHPTRFMKQWAVSVPPRRNIFICMQIFAYTTVKTCTSKFMENLC